MSCSYLYHLLLYQCTMNLLSSRLVPLIALVAIGQQYTTKQHATLVLAFAPPPPLFATVRGPIAKKEDGFSCTVQLKPRTNDDEDEDDDDEEDGLDSLMGKKLGINIGAQL